LADATILIATPAYGGSIKAMTVNSLLLLQNELQRRGIEVAYDFTSYAEITAVRNLITSRFVTRPEFTHLLFVDADMAFHPPSVLRLLKADKPLVGCFYPQRRPGGDVVGFTSRITKVPEGGLVKVDSMGMGLCLIRRDCLESLKARPEIARFVEHPFIDDYAEPIFGFFNGLPDGAWLSEDYAFCKRWTDLCGGEVWALVKEDIGHIGELVFRRDLGFDLLVPPAISKKKPGVPKS